ncbi:MAG: hypothetical protein JWM62_3378 [Frankiales bacterium]|nr:hypothetical protein [Frankiales bacterium]
MSQLRTSVRGVQELAPVATLVVATVALFVGLRTIRQRDLADRRDQWWKRYQWATDLTLSSDDHRRDLGLRALELLAVSGLAGVEEIDMLDAAVSAELSRRPDLLDDGWTGYDHGEQSPEEEEQP